MDQHDIVAVKGIAGTAPFQIFHELRIQDDAAQRLDLRLPFFGFVKVPVYFRVLMFHALKLTEINSNNFLYIFKILLFRFLFTISNMSNVIYPTVI